ALYDEDFLAWSQEQAAALRGEARGGSNQKLDWENLAEEIESSGISQKATLRSRMRRITHHLLKLEFSSATEPRRGWLEIIDDARSEIEDLLAMSPSLRTEVTHALGLALRQGSRKAIRDLEKYGEIDPDLASRVRATTYTVEQIVGDWFPPSRQS
ncbi:MAG TPA: DUF29 domain-containing protein, partial [Stellaceae bacterium]|nr:DUF29 domain-containing protein [Stellaceae bacterium]